MPAVPEIEYYKPLLVRDLAISVGRFLNGDHRAARDHAWSAMVFIQDVETELYPEYREQIQPTRNLVEKFYRIISEGKKVRKENRLQEMWDAYRKAMQSIRHLVVVT